MLNWLRKKLGVPFLCSAHSNLAPHCPACQGYTRGYREGLAHGKTDSDDVLRTPKIGKSPQRYDEIQRAQSRRRKGARV